MRMVNTGLEKTRSPRLRDGRFVPSRNHHRSEFERGTLFAYNTPPLSCSSSLFSCFYLYFIIPRIFFSPSTRETHDSAHPQRSSANSRVFSDPNPIGTTASTARRPITRTPPALASAGQRTLVRLKNHSGKPPRRQAKTTVLLATFLAGRMAMVRSRGARMIWNPADSATSHVEESV